MKMERELLDLSIGLSIEEVIEDVIKNYLLGYNLDEYYQYIDDTVFCEHVCPEDNPKCMVWLSSIAEVITRYVAVVPFKFETINEVTFNMKDNYVSIRGVVDERNASKPASRRVVPTTKYNASYCSPS